MSQPRAFSLATYTYGTALWGSSQWLLPVASCQQWSLLNRFCTKQWHCGACEENGNLQTLICVLVSRPKRCPTLSNPVPWQNWLVAYLGYTLRMKTLFCGWPVTVHDTHTRRRRRRSTNLSLLACSASSAKHEEPPGGFCRRSGDWRRDAVARRGRDVRRVITVTVPSIGGRLHEILTRVGTDPNWPRRLIQRTLDVR